MTFLGSNRRDILLLPGNNVDRRIMYQLFYYQHLNGLKVNTSGHFKIFYQNLQWKYAIKLYCQNENFNPI